MGLLIGVGIQATPCGVLCTEAVPYKAGSFLRAELVSAFLTQDTRTS